MQLSAAELVYAPCSIRPDHRAIHLHTAAPPPHGPTAANPDSMPFIPCHVHQQGPEGFDACISTARRHTPCLGPTIQHPAQIKLSRLSCAAGRSPCQQTESSLHRFWTGPGTTSLATPAAHQPNHTALKPLQSHHQFGPHAPIPAFNTFSLLRRKVMWELRTSSETARPT